MLVLSRKKNQKINICLPDGRQVVVHVAKIHGNVVRLGIAADRDVRILRNEVAAHAVKGD